MKQATVYLNKYDKKELELSLEHNFKEAMKDETFKLIVDKLKQPCEVLEKYTSTLEDCAVEYKNCLNCRNLLECKNKVEGHAYLPDVRDGNLSFGYKPCKYFLKHKKDYAHLENITILNEPGEIIDASFNNLYLKDATRMPVIKEVMEYVERYRTGDIGKGFYLHGSFGSGKTYLVASLFNELAKDGIKSSIVFWPEFLLELKTLFGADDFKDKIDSIKKSKLLLIDDLGAESTTPWNRDEVLCPILQYRMQEKLPTFITSNFTLDELESHLAISKDGVEVVKAKRILERIKQLTKDLELNSKSLRK